MMRARTFYTESGEPYFATPFPVYGEAFWIEILTDRLIQHATADPMPAVLTFPIGIEGTQPNPDGTRCFTAVSVLRGLGMLFSQPERSAFPNLDPYRRVAEALHPQPEYFFQSQARRSEQAGRWTEAAGFYRAALAFRAGCASLLFQLAMAYREQFNHTPASQSDRRRQLATGAMRALEDVIRHSASHLLAYYHLGFLYRFAGLPRAATQTWMLFLNKLPWADADGPSAGIRATGNPNAQRTYLLGLAGEIAAQLRRLAAESLPARTAIGMPA